MINTASCTLQRSPTKFSRRKAEPIPAAASHGSAHYLLAALAVVMLATTLSVVPIPSEVPLVSGIVDVANAHPNRRCTTTTTTEWRYDAGTGVATPRTVTRRSCRNVAHDHPKPKAQELKEVVAATIFVGMICRGNPACGFAMAAFEVIVDPAPSRPRQNGPPCLPGCSTSQSSSGTPSRSGSSGSGHPSGGTGR